MEFAVPPEPLITLPVVGSEARFPVHSVYCVGRNYADHAVEMGHDPDREPPFFFIKPDYAVLADGGELAYPALSQDVHHEVEMVVALKSGGSHISEIEAMDHVFGYGVGIDMTRRDLQAEAKSLARPWDAGKVFLHSAPCSALQPNSSEMVSGKIQLLVNDQLQQEGDVNQMIWKLPEVISRLSELFPLAAGDLIFTGTPAGVGPVLPGDRLTALIEGIGTLNVHVKA